MNLYRLKNRFFAVLFSRFPGLTRRWLQKQNLEDYGSPPWTPVQKRLADCRVALVTTAGVHLTTDVPFNMNDQDGDPSFRIIPRGTSSAQLRITHDYYDHRDADADINIVLPLARLEELAREQIIREVAPSHYSFMGHIDGLHIACLLRETAPEVARQLKREQVDAVVLTPA
ncbi:MAG: glycine/sarcosine/betaine reductase selenoprotein B family protein [Candidatus Binatia bacterium]